GQPPQPAVLDPARHHVHADGREREQPHRHPSPGGEEPTLPDRSLLTQHARHPAPGKKRQRREPPPGVGGARCPAHAERTAPPPPPEPSSRSTRVTQPPQKSPGGGNAGRM